MATKLFVPFSSGALIARPRLIEGLNRALACRISIVSSPPGFGKSTLLGEWVDQLPMHAGWLSLDSADNDSIRFWVYVIAALQQVKKGIGSQALAHLQSSVKPDLENVITLLVNELVSVDDSFVLILDDYHVIEDSEVHHSMMLLIRRLPANMHVCIASRKEVPFSLGSLRAKGDLHQLSIADLRFTSNEIRAYWNKEIGRAPDDTFLRLLEDRTEGWIAGLKLAALSGNDPSVPVAYISNFSGKHRYVVDYLLEEAFLHFPEEIQLFLLQTSILDRMNGSLCNAVTGGESTALIEWLEQANLFLIPLDQERYWFRYHHMFAEFLQDRLSKQLPASISSLHQKAAQWFKKHNYLYEAINHMFIAGSYEEAAILIEQNGAVFLKRREQRTLEKWLEQLPEELSRRPSMLVIQMWNKLLQGDSEKTANGVRELQEQILLMRDTLPDGFVIRVSEEIEVINLWNAILRVDMDSAYQLLEAFTARDDIHENRKHLDKEVYLVEGIDLTDGNASITQGFYGFLGRLNFARKFHEQWYRFIVKNEMHDYHFAADNYCALSEIYYESDELDLARTYAKMTYDVALRRRNIGTYVSATIVLANLCLAEWKQEEAIGVIHHGFDTLRQVGEEEYARWQHIYYAYLARLYMVRRDHERLEQLLQSSKLNLNREITIYQEYENLTMIRVLLFKEQFEEARELSLHMIKVAEQSKRVGSLLQNLLFQAAIQYALGETYQAVQALHKALQLGEQECYFRTFLDERQLLQEILDNYMEYRKKHMVPELQAGASLRYVEKLVTAMSEQTHELGNIQQKESEQVSTLTKRELEVLGCLAHGLSNKEIAEKLYLAEGTVKLHLNRVYSKLTCNNRVQALQKAKHMNLI
ncbi:LuxR C-terminal-related transcriptional regulator [Gorillibacterium massiliense]|uniref:LuxR C-terminal-related transcriptional regulator n=1 Tax=Gorillibacterium massiliense TaxID=1280390 RepID=UPI001EE26310|nr:LuxR C-terminal-related transcriptional regulator [Gorillibacterium massiliense]